MNKEDTKTVNDCLEILLSGKEYPRTVLQLRRVLQMNLKGIK